jgi:rRNA maturation endonuclease Nob1
MTDRDDEQDTAWQYRCVCCQREQYAPVVAAISQGQGACAWCGEPARVMTVAAYRAALEAGRRNRR